MAAPIWLTPVGFLGTIPELEYYETHLDAYDGNGGALTYSLITGNLPSGLELTTTGIIRGIPIIKTADAWIRSIIYAFTVRVKNSQGTVSDRTFNLEIAGLVPPVIVPEPCELGRYIDGSFVDIQLTAIEPNAYLTTVFSIVSGSLPPGVQLTSSGRIYGYITPSPAENSSIETGFDASPLSYYGFDITVTNSNRNFQFTVQVSDGVNVDTNQYTIFVYARSSMTADNDVLSADNVSEITADISNRYNPVLRTDPGLIALVRQNTRFAFKFDGLDFDNDPISYEVSSGSLPTGLSLNTTSGWLTGIVPTGTLGSVTYDFSVRVYKTDDPEFSSESKYFTVKILGLISDTVDWITSWDLGTIYNGDISGLAVSATTPSNKNLQYKLVTAGALPVGLSLLNDGSISGRVSFESFTLDGGNLTLDKGQTTFDLTYNFTIAAYDTSNTVYDERDFSVRIIQRDKKPYENLYIELLPSRAQRVYYDSIINNSDIFPPDSIYRPSDPWFGKNLTRRSLFLTGLNPADASQYVDAMALNHYLKTLNFGDVKTAQAVDENFDPIYEVVYIELVDLGVNAQGLGPNLSVSLPANSRNISTIYPNSFPNMIQRIGAGVGYENRSILPKWMTSRQPNGSVLGFTRALVLAYTKPGRSKDIAYRVSLVRNTLNLVDFTIDRYEWDTSLSKNYLKLPVPGAGIITASTVSNIVIGSGTLFNYDLYPGKTIYVANAAIGEVKTVTNNTSLILTTNAAFNCGSVGYTYSTNTFMSNNYILGTGVISANTNSAIVTGADPIEIGSGTISGIAGTQNITGVGTAFTTELRAGKTLYNGTTVIGVVSSIKSATLLMLSDPLTSGITNINYSYNGTRTAFTSELHIGDNIIANLAGTYTLLGTVSSIDDVTQLTLSANSLITVANVNFKHTSRDPYATPGQGDKYLKYPQFGVLA